MSPTNKKFVAKKQRTCLPLDQRLEIVRLRENGLSFAKIARDKKMNESRSLALKLLLKIY